MFLDLNTNILASFLIVFKSCFLVCLFSIYKLHKYKPIHLLILEKYFYLLSELPNVTCQLSFDELKVQFKIKHKINFCAHVLKAHILYGFAKPMTQRNKMKGQVHCYLMSLHEAERLSLKKSAHRVQSCFVMLQPKQGWERI